MEISVIGAGHVGLIAGVCFAEIGHDVLCVDNNAERIEALGVGRSPFFEPHVQELLEKNLAGGRLRFSLQLEDAIAHSEAIFLCVGTPPLPGGDADLSAVERVTRQIAMMSHGYKLIVEKSTVPVQTGERVFNAMRIYRAAEDGEFDVASNPEFLAEGTAVKDFLYPDRIVIGVESERAKTILSSIYEPLLDGKFAWRPPSGAPEGYQRAPMVVTNRNTSEIIKHASNSFLATKISYMNMVARLCDQVGADVSKVAAGMGLDSRIGPHFLRAGIGFGGFCFPKDLQSFVRMGEKNGCDFNLLREVERINAGQINVILEKIQNELWVLKGKRIGVWGLAFKPNTDDMRFSPAAAVVEKLLEEGAQVRAYDPEAMDEARSLCLAAEYVESAEEAADGADVLLILTEWAQFADVDFDKVREAMLRPLIIDGRNLLEGAEIRAKGFEYIAIGRI